ncbi:MAG TPA: chitobiase/beta-hexosaminidase C-terminal domain-containing protein, partial [Acidobacteriaceae bacterium]
MNKDFSKRTSSGLKREALGWAQAAALVTAAALAAPASAQSYPYSSYIPTAVPTATTTLYSAGATAIAPGRVGVDKAGNVFYVTHSGSAAGTLFEIPAASPAVTITTPTALISGLGTLNSNSAFVDASGSLWVSNGNGTGGALVEVPATNGIPNVAAIKSSGGYVATGLPLTSVTTVCSATSTTPCVWSASSINSSLTSLQVSDVYSDGAGNVYLVDISDSTSSGSYNRILQFKTTAPGSTTVLADKVATNLYAQLTVAGDNNVYYCDSLAGNSKGGLTSVISNGALTTVGNTANSNLTLVNGIVKVTAATGIASDPWGDLIISGPAQISEVPLEVGVLNFLDQFNLLVAVSGANSPVATNNIVYGGSVDVHGNYYFASATNIMLTEVGGHNFGQVPVGTEVTTAAPYLDLTWDLPSYLQTSLVSTSSPSTLSAANVSYLQSFPFGGGKNYFGGTPYSASNTGTYSQMYFQPAHPGLLIGSISPQGYSNAMGATVKTPGSDFYMNGAYIASVQGVGIGPQPMFLPGTASKAVTASQLYTSYSHTAKVVGFTPTGVGVDTFGNIFVTDTANTSLDLDCLATTANTAQNYRSGAAGNGYANSYCLTDGLADTNKSNFTGYTFKVSATSVTAGVTFPTNFTNPVDVAMDSANDAYVLDSAHNTAVVTFMPFATMIPRTVIPSNATVGGLAFSNPQGIAIDGYSNLYIADTGNNRIIQGRMYNAAYSQNVVYVPPTTSFGGVMLSSPSGLGVDASGNLFIADTGNRRIVEYSVTGVPGAVVTSGTALVSPTSVKVLPSGALVVADSTLGLVLINNGVASVLSTGSIKLSSTQGLSLDLAGNIYVADPAGGQVVELNVNSQAAASFPDTLKPDGSGSHTSSETSYVYNDGNAALNLTASPTVVDNTSSASNEFSVDPGNVCTTGVALAPNANCSLVMDFTPSSTAVVYTTVTGTATIADSFATVAPIVNPASTGQAIGSYTAGSTQKVNLSGNPVVPFTAQTITFPTPTPVTYNFAAQAVALNATGGPSGQPIVYSIVSGPGTLSVSGGAITVIVKDIGTTVVAANQAGALNGGVYYSAAPQVTQQVVVNPIGIVATPTFSVPGGTYTAVQSVTISDATPGATIYYTTNGNTPTISSPVYTGQAIAVNITTTIKAIAVGAPGYATSAVATAIYTLNPDFTLKTYVSSLTIPNGLGGSS